MSAPNYFQDRLEKLLQLAQAYAEFGSGGPFRRIGIFPDDLGWYVTQDLMPTLCFSPVVEQHSPYSTSRTEMQMVVRVSVFSYMDPVRKPEDVTKDVLGMIAKLNRFLWTYRNVDQYWNQIGPSSGDFLRWEFQPLEQGIHRSRTDVRFAVPKVDLTA